jgi:hypothetical protein
MPVRINAEEPLANCLEGSHLLDVVRVEVLELQPVHKQHSSDEPDSGDGEAALMEGHERHHVPPGRAWHGFVGRDDPLNSLSEGRQLARLNETKKLLARDSGAHPTRHRAGEVSGELGTRAAVM